MSAYGRKELVFVLEEDSARAMLEIVFSRMQFDGVHPRFLTFDGKQDLEQQFVRKLRGYLNPKARFLVIRDQDSGDCREVKKRLTKLCRTAGRAEAKVRIACRELEAFYLGDLRAVELGLGLEALQRHQNKAKYRNPDAVIRPAGQLDALTSGRYQKVAGSRAIAPHLDLDTPRSTSFRHLLAAIRSAVKQLRAL